ncbi:MAG TPA: class I SAM-dependent methyltransferase [Desulfomonilaceae bacterium]|nr:class I SAM-dependent methyltransferase [Desulfomonilaceae bacterium]
MSIGEAFDASIEYYDDWMKKALPNYADIYSTALELLTFETNAPIEVLDLGAGTGLFSEHVLRKYPKANFVLYDLAEKMLGVAKERFRDNPQQFKYVVGDYRKVHGDAEYDLIISSLSIHHLEDDEKYELFGKVYKLLRRRGIFINIDQIRGETPYLRELYWNHWLEQVRAAGFSEERIQESIGRRIPYDRDALLYDQLQWLRSSGFANVDCVYKNFFVGVFLGVKE